MKLTISYAILVIRILFPGSLAGQQTDLSETIDQHMCKYGTLLIRKFKNLLFDVFI